MQQPDQNFIASSKSNNDPQYLSEQRKQISDQVFEELMKKHHGTGAASIGQPPSALPDISPSGNQQPLPPAPKRSPFRRQASLSSRPSASDALHGGLHTHDVQQNPFFRNKDEEGAAKQKEADKKKEYAMELQNQIAQKKLQGSKPQLPPKAHS